MGIVNSEEMQLMEHKNEEKNGIAWKNYMFLKWTTTAARKVSLAKNALELTYILTACLTMKPMNTKIKVTSIPQSVTQSP